MSFYIRKSLRAGPLRFNFSKSGVGVSAGIPGFRIGTGPRGNYIHAGANGFYYRKTISKKRQARNNQPARARSDPSLPAVTSSSVVMEEIESGSVLDMRDSSSADLLDEINSKHKKRRTWPLVAFLSVVALVAFAGFPILMVKIPQLEKFAMPFACITFPILLIFTAVITFLAYQNDQLSKTVILFYELEGEAERAFQALHDAFKDLANCSRIWHISAQGNIHDLHERKRQAGADTLVQRLGIAISNKTPPYVSTNLAIPTIPVGQQSLYFFPDRMLVYDRDKVGAVSYNDLELNIGSTRFIEEGTVPKDATVVDHTWKYVNKRGGPDKRFKDNRQIPIALYSELYFTSKTGLNELVQASQADKGAALITALQKLARIQKSAQ